MAADKRWMDYLERMKRPNCIGCGVIPEEFYNVNNPGAFGRAEIRICLGCLHKQEFYDCYERLLTRGLLEKRDVKSGDIGRHGSMRGEV